MKKQKRKTLVTAGIAATTGAVVLLTGTFAWQSISQTAKNEIMGEVNPGGRLHDDFDGKNKDIYVENFMTENEGGVPLIVRTRLFEYMELGDDAGTNTDAADRSVTSIPTTAKITDNPVETWQLHKLGDSADAVDDTVHGYWTWSYGGQTVYMPTFNKNKDSLEADINGTWEGLTDSGPLVHFDDYKSYAVGDTVDGTAIYDADDNTKDEFVDGTAQENVTYTKAEESHDAAVTINGTVVTMADWKTSGMPLGDFWVYDTDGWAYWANPLYPGTATGLLLDEIKLTGAVSEKWYYSIYVDSQMVTADDIGKDKSPQTGFYDDTVDADPSTDAEALIDKLVEAINS